MIPAFRPLKLENEVGGRASQELCERDGLTHRLRTRQVSIPRRSIIFSVLLHGRLEISRRPWLLSLQASESALQCQQWTIFR